MGGTIGGGSGHAMGEQKGGHDAMGGNAGVAVGGGGTLVCHQGATCTVGSGVGSALGAAAGAAGCCACGSAAAPAAICCTPTPAGNATNSACSIAVAAAIC